MFQMHEKAQETEECEEVFLAAAKKFRHSKKVTEMWGCCGDETERSTIASFSVVSHRAGMYTNGHDQS